MTRKEIYTEIEGMFGLVPSMFKLIPDDTLWNEWELFKKTQLEEGPIPGKYRHLMGIAIAASEKCRYCVFFHTELAKLNGATEEEIQAAVHYAKVSSGWSTYLNGMQLDFDKFSSEVTQACDYVRSVTA